VQELSAAHAHCATDKAAAEDAHARERTERDLAHSRERGALEAQAAALEASVAELRDKAERLGAAVTKVRYPPSLGAPGESHVLSFCSSVRDVCVHQAREEKVAADAEVEKAGVTVSTQAATIADMEGREAAQARQIADLRRGLEGLEEQSRADAEDLAALRKQLAQVAPLRRQVETLTTEAETHTERVGALETVRAGHNPRQTCALDGPLLDCSSPPPFALRRIPLWQSLKKARDELASLAKEAAAKTDEAAQAGRRVQDAEAALKKARDELAEQKRLMAARETDAAAEAARRAQEAEAAQKKLRDELAQQKRSMAALEEQTAAAARDLTAQRDKLSSEVAALRRELADAHDKHVSTLDATEGSLKREVASLRKDLAAAKDALAAAVDDHEAAARAAAAAAAALRTQLADQKSAADKRQEEMQAVSCSPRHFNPLRTHTLTRFL